LGKKDWRRFQWGEIRGITNLVWALPASKFWQKKTDKGKEGKTPSEKRQLISASFSSNPAALELEGTPVLPISRSHFSQNEDIPRWKIPATKKKNKKKIQPPGKNSLWTEIVPP